MSLAPYLAVALAADLGNQYNIPQPDQAKALNNDPFSGSSVAMAVP